MKKLVIICIFGAVHCGTNGSTGSSTGGAGTFTLTVTNPDASLGFGNISVNGGAPFQASSKSIGGFAAGATVTLAATDSVDWGLDVWSVSPSSAFVTSSGSLGSGAVNVDPGSCQIQVTMNSDVTINATFPDAETAHCP